MVRGQLTPVTYLMTKQWAAGRDTEGAATQGGRRQLARWRFIDLMSPTRRF